MIFLEVLQVPYVSKRSKNTALAKLLVHGRLANFQEGLISKVKSLQLRNCFVLTCSYLINSDGIDQCKIVHKMVVGRNETK